jgi:hypothetical protein
MRPLSGSEAQHERTLRHGRIAGEPWHLSPENEALMREEQGGCLETDPFEDEIAAWTALRGDKTFTMGELLEAALGLRAHGKSARVTRRVSQILARLGFERRKRTTAPRTHYYARIAGADGPPSSRHTSLA